MNWNKTLHLLCFFVLSGTWICLDAQFLTQEIEGNEFAVYTDSQKGLILGAFSAEYAGQEAVGGRDLFLTLNEESDILIGPAVEQYVDVHKQGGQVLTLIRYFGFLENKEGNQFISDQAISYAIVEAGVDGWNLIANITGENFTAFGFVKRDDDLAFMVRASGLLKIGNDTLKHDIQDELLYLEMTQGIWKVQAKWVAEGDFQITQALEQNKKLMMTGKFRGEVLMDDSEWSTETPFFDGFLMEFDLSSRMLNTSFTTGVFDVSLNALIISDDDTLFIGEFVGQVNFRDASYSELGFTDTHIFIYSSTTKSFTIIRGEGDQRFVSAALIDNQLILAGNFRDSLITPGLISSCRGSSCGFVSVLDLGFEEDNTTIFESTAELAISDLNIQNSIWSICGTFSGTILDYTALGEDWFCFIQDETNTNEKEVAERVKLFPNPTGGFLFLEDYHGKDFQVLDVYGRIIYAGSWQGSLNVGNWDQGLYFLVLQGNQDQIFFTFRKL
jgi:hypothetical protein